MKKLLILIALVAGVMTVGGASTAKADHNCWGGGYGGGWGGGYRGGYGYGGGHHRGGHSHGGHRH